MNRTLNIFSFVSLLMSGNEVSSLLFNFNFSNVCRFPNEAGNEVNTLCERSIDFSPGSLQNSFGIAFSLQFTNRIFIRRLNNEMSAGMLSNCLSKLQQRH